MKKKQILIGEQRRWMHIEHPLERSLGEEGTQAYFKGNAAVYDSWSEVLMGDFVETIAKGALSRAKFDRCIAVFNHNENLLLGTVEAGTLKYNLTDEGLSVSIEESGTSISRDCGIWVGRGEVRRMSFKFTVASGGSEWRYDSDAGLYRHFIHEIDEVLDVSLVTRAAYTATEVKSRGNIEAYARSLGVDIEGVREALQEAKKEPEEVISQEYVKYRIERALKGKSNL